MQCLEEAYFASFWVYSPSDDILLKLTTPPLWALHTKSVGNKRFEFDFRFHILVCLSKVSMPYDQSPIHVWGLPSVLASPISWGQQGSLEIPGLLDSIWIQTGPLWDILHVVGMRPVGSLTPKLFFIMATCLCVVQPTHLVVDPWPCSNRPLITSCITRISASESWDSESTALWGPIHSLLNHTICVSIVCFA